MTGAQATVAALCVERTRCAFGVPGAQNNELWDAMKAHGLPYLLVTNESSASIMADASARATGVPGVFAVVPGPGLTNALTGIGEALYDSVPIVGIVTDIDRRPGAPIGQVHGLANAAILRPVCKLVLEVRHQGQIPPAIHQAFRAALCGEPGPAAVVIPYHLYAEVWDYDEPLPPPPTLSFDEAAYRRALGLLSNRRYRVGIYAGMGCQDAAPSLAAVAETLQAPVATSVSGKGAIAENHPLSVGWGYGPQGTRTAERTFCKDVDLVLAVGVRYSENSTANYSIPGKERLIHVDANPHNLGRNVPADVAVCADSRLFLDRLLADAAAIRRPPGPALWRTIAGRRAADRCSYQQVQIQDGVDPMVFLVHLRRLLGPDELLFVDVTTAVHWAAEAVDVCGPRRFFTPANNQSMGWAVPAAVGAQRVRPDRRVAAVTGDGCFLMTGLEASTAAREGLPVKFFVLDDGAYHYMQMLQIPTFRRTTATEIARIDFAALAQGLRLSFNCIPTNADITPGIARALATPGPVLTRVVVRYDGRQIRWLDALKSSYIDHLRTGQKVRMAGRIAARSLDRRPDND
jgi:acetolactate synthase-1/2/3 large subunit